MNAYGGALGETNFSAVARNRPALLPKDISGDVGYSSEEHYLNMEQRHRVNDVKHNCSFRRFSLLGLKKVAREQVIVCISHNI